MVDIRVGRIIAAEAYAVHRAYIEDPALPIDPWVRKRVLGGKAISQILIGEQRYDLTVRYQPAYRKTVELAPED